MLFRSITVKYFKLDVDFPKNLNNNRENLLYGEAYNPSFSTSADLDIYLTIDNDMFVMNRYGIVPNQTGIAHFMIDEFNFAFPRLGSIETIAISQTVTGEIASLTGEYFIPVSSWDGWLSGGVSGELEFNASPSAQTQIEYNVP